MIVSEVLYAALKTTVTPEVPVLSVPQVG